MVEQNLTELLEQAPEVTKVQIVNLERGDIVVLSAPGSISNETANRLKEYFERHFEAEGLKCMVLGDAMEVHKVLRPAAKEPT
jgi:hypothetical protein